MAAPKRIREPPGPFLPKTTRTELLAPVRHWTARRKERLLSAIVDEQITVAEAMAAHSISDDELAEWARRFIASNATEYLKATRKLPHA